MACVGGKHIDEAGNNRVAGFALPSDIILKKTMFA